MPDELLTQQNNQLQTDNATLVKENNRLKTKLDAAVTAEKGLQVKIDSNAVASAIDAGKLLPAKKDYAANLTGQGLADYLQLEANSTQITNDEHLNPDAQQNNAVDSDVMAQLGINESGED